MTLLRQPAQTTFQLASHISEDKGFHPIHMTLVPVCITPGMPINKYLSWTQGDKQP